jgi:tRNA 2-thiouridine synthesizing protein A|tara:strand:- start:402 stop:632 length:231 start_codon:yes stop_codon:yes gene_type:complete
MIKKPNFINLKGLRCPLPVLKIAKRIKDIKKGDYLEIEVDDPKAENDINELTKNIRIKIIKKKKENNFMFLKIKKL